MPCGGAVSGNEFLRRSTFACSIRECPFSIPAHQLGDNSAGWMEISEHMGAKYILASLSLVFLVAGLARLVRDGHLTPSSRTWLTVATLFGVVSIWLSFIPS